MPEFTCGAPDCEFHVRTDDADEVIDIVRRHARERHDREVDEERVRERMEP